MKFSELSNKDRYRIIRMGVQNGIHSVSDIEHIFDEGGHLYDEGTNWSQQMMPKKLTDYDQSDWSKTYTKQQAAQQAANNAKIKIAQAEWDKMHDEVLSHPDAYDAIDMLKYAGKRPETLEDVARVQKHIDDAESFTKGALGLVTAPFAGSAIGASKAAGYIAPIAKSMLAGMGADAVSELATGQPVAEHTKDAIQFATGLNPRNNVISNFAVDTFGNPFYGFTGESAQMWSNGINKGAQIAKNSKEINKRLVETAMRTTGDPNPLPMIVKNIKQMKSTKEGRNRLKNIGKYILLNERNGIKGYYNSFAELPQFYYDGFTHSMRQEYGNDMIDAFLYGKEIDPKFGLKRVSVGNIKDFGPFEKEYIPKNYANKANDIQVYEVDNIDNAYGVSFLDKNTTNNLNIQPQINENGSLKVEPKPSPYGENEAFFEKNENAPAVDAGGFLFINGKDLEGLNYKQAWDIWKFNPKDYVGKWLSTDIKFNDKIKEKLKAAILKQGLSYVDKLGTPVITRSKWARTSIKPETKLNEQPSIDIESLSKIINNLK